MRFNFFFPLQVGSTGIEAAWAGGTRGREVTDRFLPAVAQLLSSKGLFYLITIAENDPGESRDVPGTFSKMEFTHILFFFSSLFPQRRSSVCSTATVWQERLSSQNEREMRGCLCCAFTRADGHVLQRKHTDDTTAPVPHRCQSSELHELEVDMLPSAVERRPNRWWLCDHDDNEEEECLELGNRFDSPQPPTFDPAVLGVLRDAGSVDGCSSCVTVKFCVHHVAVLSILLKEKI